MSVLTDACPEAARFHELLEKEARYDALLADFAACEADRDDLRRKLADASLANEALRTALESLRPVVHEPYEWEPDPVNYANAIDAALALPVDGFAEEVRTLLTNAEPYGMSKGIKSRQEYYDRRDALLAKLGARP